METLLPKSNLTLGNLIEVPSVIERLVTFGSSVGVVWVLLRMTDFCFLRTIT